jgi:two-component system, LytTR family, sensor kinase
LQRYLDIEKIRFGHRLNFSTNIPNECNDFKIPNMILQPLIENAIKHGVYDSTEEVLVELKCTQDDDHVIIEIRNEYDPDTKKKKGEGIGLKNIKKRLQIIYKRQDLFEVSAEKLMFRATLKLPKR